MKKMAPAMKQNGPIPPGIQTRKILKAMQLCEFYDMQNGRP
jgi:ribosomal protein L39E